MNANNRMVLNTTVMYGRLAITMVVTLLSSRWVLMALGQEDFGIYNLISGLLSMLMFLNLTMATASQRFLSFALGKGDRQLIFDTFYYSCALHFLIGVIIVLGIEIIGQLLLQTVLQVPDGKMYLAVFCLHSLAVSTFFTVISVPYNAVLISHENILFVAIVEILSAISKLVAAIILLNYDGERLKLYALIMAGIPICQSIIYRIYCERHYKETKIKIRKIKDYSLFRQFTAYAGWNLIGSISSLLRTQGVSMLLNSFHGVAMNAAYGIATQVKGQFSHFSSSIVTATRPQIVKSEGMCNRQRVHSLSAMTCKTTFMLLSMLSVPLILEMPYVLQLWLKDVPDYAVSFTRLILIINLLFQFAVGLSMPIESVGKIKSLQIWVGGLHFVVLPIGYIMLKSDFSPESVFVMVAIEESVGIVLRMIISRKVTGLSISGFITNTLAPSVISLLVLFCVAYVSQQIINEGLLRLCVICVISMSYTLFIGYNFVLNVFERRKIDEIVGKLVIKIKKMKPLNCVWLHK